MDKELIRSAIDAKSNSYSPYSKFRVGAALRDQNGNITNGCNIESISFSPTICAERTAIFKAVSEGITNFSSIAVASDDENYSTPCGVCLQVMSEFVTSEFTLYLINSFSQVQKVSFKDLLPHPFTPKSKIGKA